jgi:hypothetical protein
VLRRLNGAAEVLLPVLLQADSLADAGRVLGLSESGVCLRVQAMTARALAMAERAQPAAPQKPKPARKSRPRQPQKNTVRAVADAQRLLCLPGLPALAQARLQALVQHGCAKRAAAALGCNAQNIRGALCQVRQAAK